MLASEKGHIATVQLLVSHNCDVNIRDKVQPEITTIKNNWH